MHGASDDIQGSLTRRFAPASPDYRERLKGRAVRAKREGAEPDGSAPSRDDDRFSNLNSVFVHPDCHTVPLFISSLDAVVEAIREWNPGNRTRYNLRRIINISGI